jgi:hypothetical protein
MDPVESYLDDLARRLRIGRVAARRLLAEAEEHLRQSVEEEVAAGVDSELAQRRAVARFGTAREVAAAANEGPLGRLGALAASVAHIGAVGSLAVLAGAVAARLVAAVTSATAVFGLPPGHVPAPSRAAHWLAVQPSAAHWSGAAAAENADDTLLLRGGFALFCLIGSLVVLRIGRRRLEAPGAGMAIVGVTIFGGAAVLLLLGGLTNTYAPVEWGRGLWFSDAAVAALAAATYAIGLRRRLSR